MDVLFIFCPYEVFLIWLNLGIVCHYYFYASLFLADLPSPVQMDVFPYSVFYIFFEQYLDVWKIALINIAIALGWYSKTV